MPIKEKIEVEMLSPLMAEFIPDYSDIVDLDDAEPLEGPDLVQYQPSIAAVSYTHLTLPTSDLV